MSRITPSCHTGRRRYFDFGKFQINKRLDGYGHCHGASSEITDAYTIRETVLISRPYVNGLVNPKTRNTLAKGTTVCPFPKTIQ